jgi:hypothetical protein
VWWFWFTVHVSFTSSHNIFTSTSKEILPTISPYFISGPFGGWWRWTSSDDDCTEPQAAPGTCILLAHVSHFSLPGSPLGLLLPLFSPSQHAGERRHALTVRTSIFFPVRHLPLPSPGVMSWVGCGIWFPVLLSWTTSRAPRGVSQHLRSWGTSRAPRSPPFELGAAAKTRKGNQRKDMGQTPPILHLIDLSKKPRWGTASGAPWRQVDVEATMLPIKYTQFFTGTWDGTWNFAYFALIRIVLMIWWLIEPNAPEICRQAEVLQYFCSIGRRGWGLGKSYFPKIVAMKAHSTFSLLMRTTTIHVSASFSVVIQQRRHLVDPYSFSVTLITKGRNNFFVFSVKVSCVHFLYN